MDISDSDDRDMMAFGEGPKAAVTNMTVPERIVLSAGYDGDENRDSEPRRRFRDSTAFDETPIVIPEDVMGGMQTPPSILTIDHSANLFQTTSPNRHSEGDGADKESMMTNMHKYTRLQPKPNDEEEDEEGDISTESSLAVTPKRSVVVVGQENHYYSHIPFDDPRAMQQWYGRMQRRLTILENQLERQQGQSAFWNYALLAMTIINPIVINYLFFSRRR